METNIDKGFISEINRDYDLGYIHELMDDLTFCMLHSNVNSIENSLNSLDITVKEYIKFLGRKEEDKL
jgi:hypothetical protein